MNRPMTRRARYGIDAPSVVNAHLIAGSLIALIAVVGLVSPGLTPLSPPANLAAAALAALLLFYGAVMLTSSLVGKRQVCDRLVAALALQGDEQVLDAGCGRGLALIACAKALTTGRAVGIDLWAAKDLSDNNPDATRANAVAEGVADRVEVQTGDITSLPFADVSFHVVISMIVIHNIPTSAARDQAVGELVRVLKPGGRMVLFDLLHMTRYADVLRQAGLEVRDLGRDRLWLLPCRSLLARKPAPPAEPRHRLNAPTSPR